MRYLHYILTLAIALGLVSPAMACCCAPEAPEVVERACCGTKPTPSEQPHVASFNCQSCPCCVHSTPTPDSVPAPLQALLVKPFQAADAIPLLAERTALPLPSFGQLPLAQDAPLSLSRHVLFCTYRC